ncbi:MAG: NAD regulator [Pseudomonadota bacterium]
MNGTQQLGIEIGLHAVVVAVDDSNPNILIVDGTNAAGDNCPGLPYGPFDPTRHRTLEMGLREWVDNQTQLKLGYVEQLYTFGDRSRLHADPTDQANLVSVGYLALVRQTNETGTGRNLQWNSWYSHFPWEDWRGGQPSLLGQAILPQMADWVRAAPLDRSGSSNLERQVRFRLAFGCDLPDSGAPVVEQWDDERVLERYELMYEAGFVDEAVTDGRFGTRQVDAGTGRPMLHDHRRILATAMARLRAKLKYRPVVFELMPDQFTLTELQQTVEHISGRGIHKQNFRRLVETAQLVEPTGARSSNTGGRPAAYYRFRRSILRERPAPGLRIGARG